MTLLSLPLLAVEGIAEALCPHCTQGAEPRPWKTPLYCHDTRRRLLTNTRALANLAATCRAMYSIVTPVLYHQLQGYSRKRVRLFRVLSKRPELARRVRVLRLDFDGGLSRFPEDKDDRDFLLELAAQHGWSVDMEHTREMFTTLLIALCPNIATLSTGRCYFEDFGLLRPATLPRLRDVYITHLDTEMGVDIGTLTPLYLAAANMETFSVAMASGVGNDDLALGNVRDLRLDASCISTGCLRALLRSCPRLESFAYTAGGMTVSDRQFQSGDARRLLCRWAPKLKRLTLDLCEAYDMDDWDEESDDGTPVVPGFASLARLETLVIDPGVIDDWDQKAMLFPQSLRSFRVLGAYPPEKAKLGQVEWREFRALARTFLPNLVELEVAGFDLGKDPGA